MIRKGYNHVKENICAIRKPYNKAVSKGTRSVATLILLLQNLGTAIHECFVIHLNSKLEKNCKK